MRNISNACHRPQFISLCFSSLHTFSPLTLYLGFSFFFLLLCGLFQMVGNRNTTRINLNRVKADVQKRIPQPFLEIVVSCIFLSSRLRAGQWSTHQATLGWCGVSHTVLSCPCTLCCEGFHPSRNALPIMRVRGQSAAAPGGRDLPGTLSHWLCPYI